MALYEKDRHEALTQTPWSEVQARAALGCIVADVHDAYRGPGEWWPIHPIDVSPERAEVLKPVYYGAAGVIWTLDHLNAAGFAAAGCDYASTLPALLAGHRGDSARLGPSIGYPGGDAGILLLQAKLAPSATAADDLAETIEANLESPAFGFMGGGAGSMLAALFMFERTQDARWRDLYLRGFDWLWRNWTYDADLRCHLWTMDFRGGHDKWSGGLHGWPAIVSAMLRGRALLSPERADELERRAHQSLSATALREGTFANWKLMENAPAREDMRRLLVQHCWGAPGMVNCLAALPSTAETDALLCAAGELTWAAGPISKLVSLCHGVPGSGYALLKLHERTGDDVWLERARAFAMHAIEQADLGLATHGQRKISLWTGDLGLACYLSDCIRATHRFPTLDYFM